MFRVKAVHREVSSDQRRSKGLIISRNVDVLLILIHPFDSYVIWPGSLALMNRQADRLASFTHGRRLPGQNCIRDVIIERVYSKTVFSTSYVIAMKM